MLYNLQLCKSSVCVPISSIFPLLNTSIFVQFCTVEVFWEDINVVILFCLAKIKIFFNICDSVYKSKELVTSSKSNTFGQPIKALDIFIRCFWPPDKLLALLCTIKSKDFSLTKFIELDNSKLLRISSFVVSLPKEMFSKMVLVIKSGFWTI